MVIAITSDGKEGSIQISEAARILGVSSSTLRIWHKNGKLVPEIVLNNGIRVYSMKQIREFIMQNKNEKKRA